MLIDLYPLYDHILQFFFPNSFEHILLIQLIAFYNFRQRSFIFLEIALEPRLKGRSLLLFWADEHHRNGERCCLAHALTKLSSKNALEKQLGSSSDLCVEFWWFIEISEQPGRSSLSGANLVTFHWKANHLLGRHECHHTSEWTTMNRTRWKFNGGPMEFRLNRRMNRFQVLKEFLKIQRKSIQEASLYTSHIPICRFLFSSPPGNRNGVSEQIMTSIITLTLWIHSGKKPNYY